MRGRSILQPSAPYRAGNRWVEPDPFEVPVCFETGTPRALDVHHIYPGANRAKSDELGCWVYLAHNVHMALHDHLEPFASLGEQLKALCQRTLEEEHGWTRGRFIETFGKSYL